MYFITLYSVINYIKSCMPDPGNPGLKKTTDKNEFEGKVREMLVFAVAMGMCNCQYISASCKKNGSGLSWLNHEH